MAGTLRCLARAAKFTTLQKVAESLAAPSTFSACRFQVQMRNINVKISPNVNSLDVSKLPEYETSDKEWDYVERLLPLQLVPAPKKFDGPAPSGWIPPKAKPRDHPYFVPRNKNHMMQVYLAIKNRGSRHLTKVRNIDGDIWALKDDVKRFLKAHLTPMQYARLGIRVNEMTRQIHIRGDYVAYVKKWMEIKGF